MKPNIGPLDRSLRVIIGIVVLFFGFYYSSWLGLLGIIPLATAAIGWCPLYSLIGISTKREKMAK